MAVKPRMIAWILTNFRRLFEAVIFPSLMSIHAAYELPVTCFRTGLVRHGADLKAHVVNTASQYNLPPNKVNLKNVSARERLGITFDDPLVQRNIDLDMAV